MTEELLPACVVTEELLPVWVGTDALLLVWEGTVAVVVPLGRGVVALEAGRVEEVVVTVESFWLSRMSRAFIILCPVCWVGEAEALLRSGMLAVRTVNDCSGCLLP